ncbi:uncharacterized protein [Oscarella lobularis]|uniref:uncharacterized protein n=1 Tax=Oscarella lobularis TaxID=121494 RepID=UPI0033135489
MSMYVKFHGVIELVIDLIPGLFVMSSDGIVKLNVGGVVYVTTESTLLSHPNSFFSSLLSQRLPTTQDEGGALFIDRTGEYFLPILHYLRTRRLFIPPNVDVEAVQEEARYFLLTDLVDEIDKILETKRAEKEPEPSNVLRRDGFYVNLEESKAFIFRNQDDGGDGQKLKLVVVRAKHDILTQAKFSFALRGASLPDLWDNDAPCKEALAQFFANHFKRGYYNIEGNSVILTVESTVGGTANIPALLCDDVCTVSMKDDPRPFWLISIESFLLASVMYVNGSEADWLK